jgi:hypothetical protein
MQISNAHIFKCTPKYPNPLTCLSLLTNREIQTQAPSLQMGLQPLQIGAITQDQAHLPLLIFHLGRMATLYNKILLQTFSSQNALGDNFKKTSQKTCNIFYLVFLKSPPKHVFIFSKSLQQINCVFFFNE